MVSYYKNGNIGVIEFNDPDSKVNLLSNKNLDILKHIMDHIIEDDRHIKSLFFISRKEDIFIAGADIRELATICAREEAIQICKKGQDLFNKIASLNMPTFAVVNGACVGGGLELALSCDYILATRNKKIRFGLPEVKLGIIPGFGGSYRLKKKIGARKARYLIDTGKFVNAKEAKCLKLVDKIIPEKDSFLYPKLMRIHRRTHKLTTKKLILSENKKKFELDRSERELLARKILQSPARNRLSSYLLISKYRNIYSESSIKETLPIERCVVIGAGTMGRDIAYLINSQLGLPVRLKDTNNATLKKARFYIKGIYKDAVKRGILYHDEAKLKFKYISYGEEQSKDADIVVESIIEDISIKKLLFAKIERQFSARCILTSNTSCISIEELSKSLRNAERFLGMHFFNPAYKMKLVEVVPTKFTSKLVLETVIYFLHRMKRIPIIVKDSPGFLVNRMLLPYLNEALFMLEQGFSREAIDKAMTGFGMPVGPLQLLGDIGVDVAYKASKILEENFGNRMKVPNMLKKEAKQTLQLQLLQCSRRACSAASSQDIVERLLSPIRREAELCLEEGVVENREIIDLALLLGIGFPGSKRIWKK